MMVWFSYIGPVLMVVSVWIAYRVGKRTRGQDQPGHGELGTVVQDLKKIVQQVRGSFVSHHSPEQPRTDPLTGLSSRRAMEDILKLLLAMKSRYETRFAIALVEIDGVQKIHDECGNVNRGEMLWSFAATLISEARETDVVVRFGSEEFIVIMPETDLAGAGVFGQRLRKKVHDELDMAISIGVADARDGDTQKSLLSRTDSALYSAKAGGGNTVFQHTGRRVEIVGPMNPVSPVLTIDNERAELAATATSV